MFLVIMATSIGSSALAWQFPNGNSCNEIPGHKWLAGKMRTQESLSASYANYDCRNIFHIDEGIEIFSASQIRKMDDAVGHLRDFASHFFSRSQVELNRFARAALKDAGDARIGLQAGFVLSERASADCRGNDHYKKK
jgi:hypothetical protein